MSKNKRAGVTSRGLTLAIRPFACDTSTLSLKDIKEMLERTSVSDVEQWRKVWFVSKPNEETERKINRIKMGYDFQIKLHNLS